MNIHNEREIQRYLGRLEANLEDRLLPDRLVEVLAEAETHLLESMDALEELGVEEQLLARLAIESYGESAHEVARNLSEGSENRSAAVALNSSLAVASFALVFLFHLEFFGEMGGGDIVVVCATLAIYGLLGFELIRAAWRAHRFRLDLWFGSGLLMALALTVIGAPFWVDYGAVDGMEVGSAIPHLLGIATVPLPERTWSELLLGSAFMNLASFGGAIVMVLGLVIPTRVLRGYWLWAKPQRKGRA